MSPLSFAFLSSQGHIMTIAKRLPDYIHPLLATLRKDDPSGESRFWARVAETRAPLIESDPSSPNHSLVTFVFPCANAAHHVVVSPGFNEHEPVTNMMERIAGTNVWHASYRYGTTCAPVTSFVPTCRSFHGTRQTPTK
jgi:hypothetical protein